MHHQRVEAGVTWRGGKGRGYVISTSISIIVVVVVVVVMIIVVVTLVQQHRLAYGHPDQNHTNSLTLDAEVSVLVGAGRDLDIAVDHQLAIVLRVLADGDVVARVVPLDDDVRCRRRKRGGPRQH
jgi:hypothetical protein